MAAQEFDYIIVGGGSAGCVLANRLSADPHRKVLLVEAGGGDRNILYKWPAGFAKMTKGIGSWGYSTVPQKHMKERVLWYTQAKVIGGGSTINAQIYTRGNRQDFDHWAQLGCTGWGYDDVLPYFRKAEDNDTHDNETHGRGGPIGVSQSAYRLPISKSCRRIWHSIQRRPDKWRSSGMGVLSTHTAQRASLIHCAGISQASAAQTKPDCHNELHDGAHRA
jgi:choline dehydrogenase